MVQIAGLCPLSATKQIFNSDRLLMLDAQSNVYKWPQPVAIANHLRRKCILMDGWILSTRRSG